MSARKKRTKFFVDKSVQGSIAKRVTIHWICFFAIMIALQVLTTWMVNPMSTRGELFKMVVQNNGLFLMAVVLLLPSFVFDTVKLSNRFAGPMVRLKNAFQEVAETGELKEIQFRDGDFWMDIAEKYNAMVRVVNEKQKSESTKDVDSKENERDGSENSPSSEFDSAYMLAEKELDQEELSPNVLEPTTNAVDEDITASAS